MSFQAAVCKLIKTLEISSVGKYKSMLCKNEKTEQESHSSHLKCLRTVNQANTPI